MCGNAKPHATVDVLKAAFKPTKTVVKEHLRADTMSERTWEIVAPKKAQVKAPAREAKARRAA